MAITGTVVLDPGHGGSADVGGSDANHAVSPSGMLEKNLTLEIARLAQSALQAAAPSVRVVLTRASDVNLSLAARAAVASAERARLFLSIHFNGFDGVARGVEAFVRSSADGNVNLAEDIQFAKRVQKAVLEAIRKRDAQTKDRGVKEMRLGVLADPALGNTPASHPCRACLLEIEFMDVPAVDRLLNTGQDAPAVRAEIGAAIKDAILAQLQA